ncbi:MAG: site-specific DNA-methyltransferase [Bacteroidetes bacterium]|nr:site-specific DNA-methyltransferase [Bacteroidota bacterium]
MPTLHFKGKSFVQNHHLAVKFHQLTGVKSKSLTDKVSLHDNLIIQGDNLKALKALLPTYAGKVKCIYIDPPYNTGNEKWVYNDNVNSPMMQAWLGNVVDKDDLTRHDKWLCMMMPRLKLLKELLAEDGVICINLDDVETSNCRILMDEVFGTDNFLALIAWEKRFTRSNNAKLFSSIKDTLIVYRKSDQVEYLREDRSDKSNAIYANPDKDARGPWTSVSYVNPATKEARPNLVYKITNPYTKKKVEHPTNAWKYAPETHKKHVDEKRLWWGEDGSYNYPRLKKFLSEVSEGIVPVDLWRHDVAGTTDEGSKDLEDLMGRAVFDNPKPAKLIKKVLRLFSTDGDLVMDSFAGSATTAQAVLQLNKEEDGGNRRFILVEMEDYADAITAERVRRVIKGVPTSKNFKEGTGGSFSYFKLGPPIEMEQILHGKDMPTYEDLARYVYFTATGEEFNAADINRKMGCIGTSKHYPGGVYLYYEPDMNYLMSTALTLDTAKALGPHKNQRRLVFAPQKYLDQDYLDIHRIDYHQLPFEIYRFKD